MSIGLSFRGSRRSPQPGSTAGAVSEAVQALQGQFSYALYQDSPTQLTLEFCPMGLLSLRVDGDVIEGSAATTPAGPGFHRAVVELLGALAAAAHLRLEVDDETEFWTHRDFARLQQAHMIWLQAVIRQVSARDESSFRICWPLEDWAPAGEGAIVTPLGAFTHAYLRAELERDKLHDFAGRFFVWLNPERDALYHRAVALYLMWNDCRWVPPRTDTEEAVLAEVFYSLKQARSLDGALPLPLQAWAEVVELAGGKPDGLVTGADMAQDRPIGYRRGDVTEPFPGGWHVRLPGVFLKEQEEDGGHVFWDIGRNFRLTPYRYAPQPGEGPTDNLTPNPAFDAEIDGYRYRAMVTYDADERCWLLQGQVSGPGGMALVTMTWDDDQWADWAAATFRGIQPPPFTPD